MAFSSLQVTPHPEQLSEVGAADDGTPLPLVTGPPASPVTSPESTPAESASAVAAAADADDEGLPGSPESVPFVAAKAVTDGPPLMAVWVVLLANETDAASAVAG